MEGGDIDKEEEGGQWGALGGPYRDRSRYVRRGLEDKGALPPRKEGGNPVDHVRGNAFGEEEGSQFRRIDVIESGFYVEKHGRDFQKGPMEGSNFVDEGGYRVSGAEAGKEATLVLVE